MIKVKSQNGFIDIAEVKAKTAGGFVDIAEAHVKTNSGWEMVFEKIKQSPLNVIINATANQSINVFYTACIGKFTVDWGDGNSETINRTTANDTVATHTYTTTGIYHVIIRGKITAYPSTITSSTRSPINFFNCINVIDVYGDVTQLFPEEINGIKPVFASMFRGCKGLTFFPQLTSLNTYSSDNPYFYARTYSGCSNITSKIEKSCFFNTITSSGSSLFYYTFESCSKITEIDSNIFESVTITATVSNMFMGMFNGCSRLVTIPTGLFLPILSKGNLTSSMYNVTFANCTSLVSIPSDLFSYSTGNVNSKTFSGTFSYCTSLASIPSGLFSTYTGKTYTESFSNTFANCINLISIPANLFANITGNSGNYSFNQTFYNCSSLTNIPANLFPALITGTTPEGVFYQTFANCSELTTIPAGTLPTFEGYVSPYLFFETFYNCTKLTSIPENLFIYKFETSPSTSVVIDVKYAFYGTFENCGLINIPNSLFAGSASTSKTGSNTEYTFARMFYSCKNLISIPNNFLSAQKGPFATLDYSFSEMFAECENLKTIGAGSFGNIYGMYTYKRTFYNCINLENLPSGMFKYTSTYNELQGAFYETFANCINLTNINNTTFSFSMVRNFNYMFYRMFYNCSSLESTPFAVFSSNKKFYDQFPSALDNMVKECFFGCVAADDYAAIPSKWK